MISPGRDTNQLQVSSQQMLKFIYLSRKDGKLSELGRKVDHTNVQILVEAGIELGTLWLEGSYLNNYPNFAALTSQSKMLIVLYLTMLKGTRNLLD